MPYQVDRIDPSKTALIVVDMENDFVAPGAPMETPAGRAMLPNLKRAIAFWYHPPESWLGGLEQAGPLRHARPAVSSTHGGEDTPRGPAAPILSHPQLSG
jgi:nicotinamidase-related amidase